MVDCKLGGELSVVYLLKLVESMGLVAISMSSGVEVVEVGEGE